ncbi:hypothetical protein HPP92_022211 [Vanilla planifolia]|uniref:Gnk2-homologous domain-containing protein n=1 Tax=Vanilla planifolia TaxID=51239 RepID=A0A835UF75_VANPL|nr:hypothetical protein HPP92_022211 [Vanilla planifolia]
MLALCPTLLLAMRNQSSSLVVFLAASASGGEQASSPTENAFPHHQITIPCGRSLSFPIDCSRRPPNQPPQHSRFLPLTPAASSTQSGRSAPAAPVYALVFCRGYLSRDDCLACLDSATVRLRACGAGTGGRVIYDGCNVRYESARFFDQGTLLGILPSARKVPRRRRGLLPRRTGC